MFVNQEHFKPCWWLPTGHLQTCVAALTPRPFIATQTEQIPLVEGDQLELCWLQPEVENALVPTVILLHGLEGSVQSHYIQGMLKAIQQKGWRGVVLHFRGSNGRVNALPQSYHGGKTEDFVIALQTIQLRYPDEPCFAVGYSLGGNVLLKFLGEYPDQKGMVQAVSVSAPFDLGATSKYLGRGIYRIYERHFIKKLKYSILRKLKHGIDMPINLSTLSKIKDFCNFDRQITAPLHGFQSAEDYYVKNSSKYFLKTIITPTLIIHAEDDPMIPKAVIPTADSVSPAVTLEVHQKGGHIGFISGGYPGRLKYWLENRVIQHLSDKLL